MLVLTRKKHEKILIGDSIIVTVVAVERDQVRIGITAPRNIKVYREELAVEISRANREAAATEIPDLSALLAKRPKSDDPPSDDPEPESSPSSPD